MKKKLFVALAAVFVAVFYSSCEKEPVFAGKWEYVALSDFFDMRMVLDLSESSMVMSMFISGDDGASWEELGGLEGDITYTDETITVTPTRAKAIDGYDVEWFGPGDELYEEMLEDMGFENNKLVIGYSVNGDQMTLTMDGDTQVFTKID